MTLDTFKESHRTKSSASRRASTSAKAAAAKIERALQQKEAKG